jgi:uncharacterized protein YneF (UPF0154 family)
MTEKKETPQEIDLIELFSKIANWFSSKIRYLLDILLQVFYFLTNNIIWLVSFLIIGLIIGFYIHKIQKLYYHTEMVGISNTITNSEVIRNINNWNYESVFTEDEVQNIKSIKATFLLDKNNDDLWDIIDDFDNINTSDTNIINERVKNYFCVKIEVYDTSLISNIEKKLLQYISNNKRVVNLNTINTKQKEDLIPIIEKEISDLDSLRKFEYFTKQKTPSIKFNETLLVSEQETKLYHKDILYLTKLLQEEKRELFLKKDPFDIILDFYVPIIEENNLTNTLVNSVKLSLLFGLIILIFIKKKKRIK